MNPVIDRELILSRAYEHALRSAFAHGSVLTDFSFSQDATNDVSTLESQSDHEGREMLRPYDTAPPFTIPPTFLDDTDTLLPSHYDDLAQIARELVYNADAEMGLKPTPTFADVFNVFAHASLAFHESLVLATDALFRIHNPQTAAHLVHTLFPRLLETSEHLSLAVLRLKHPHLTAAIQQGTHSQIHIFLTCGHDLGVEPEFFTHHVHKFLPRT